jgi:bisphosphoglycerate-dependent phosphoglycerate mutase
MSEVGVQDSLDAGKALKSLGLNFDMMLTSAHKRALLTSAAIKESYPDLPAHLMLQIHEVGGIHMLGKTYPGLSMSQMKELLPSLHVSEEQSALIPPEEGWFSHHKEVENEEQGMQRAKEVLRQFRNMAK